MVLFFFFKVVPKFGQFSLEFQPDLCSFYHMTRGFFPPDVFSPRVPVRETQAGTRVGFMSKFDPAETGWIRACAINIIVTIVICLYY